MPLLGFNGKSPAIHPSVFVAPGAYVIGDVTIGADSSVWYNAVLRADGNPIHIGERTNIQDGAVVHIESGLWSTSIGDGCVVGHRAIVHGCTVGNDCLIGMGAVVMNGARIGDGSVVAAGAVVREGTEFSPRSLIAGVPARLVRILSEEEVEALVRKGARGYVELARRHRTES